MPHDHPPHKFISTYLAQRLLASTAAHSHTVHNISLLRFITHSAGLIWSAWAGQTSDARQLSVFPAAHTLEKTKHIALLFLPKLFHVLHHFKFITSDHIHNRKNASTRPRRLSAGCHSISCAGRLSHTYFVSPHDYSRSKRAIV